MKNKIIIIIIILLAFAIFSSNAFAADGLENATLITPVELEEVTQDIEVPYESQDIVDDEIISSNEVRGDITVTITDLDEKDVLAVETEIIITDDNYDAYFNRYTGKFKSTIDSSKIETLKIGNVSNCIFTIEKPLNVLPLDSNSQITNGVIHLMSGASGSTIKGIRIYNNDSVGDIYYDGILISRAHGIWFTNSNNNLIYNNTIIIGYQHGCYAVPMGNSHNNQFLNNTIISGLTSCFVMGGSNYNNISNNYVEITAYDPMTTSNLIYFNPWGHVDYKGTGDCKGTYISNNYFKNFGKGEWAITLSLGGMGSENTTVINNTVIKGVCGIGLSDSFFTQPKNGLVKGNTIINSSIAIFIGSNNVVVSDNRIFGSSDGYGISIQADDDFKYLHNVTVSNNYIEFDNLGAGIQISSDNVTSRNNEIHISRYGQGIIVSPTDLPQATSNNCILDGNRIYVVGDEGIVVVGNNTTISNNFISTKSGGIVLSTNSYFYDNSIIGNVIKSDDYGIYVGGFVFNTVVQYNDVESNQSEGIYFNPIGPPGSVLGNVTENTVNGVIENTETLIINDTNFYDYFDNTGYLNYEFKPNSRKMIFFTFLTNKNIYFIDKITLKSNKMANLLYNVTIKFMDDASGSSIEDFKFYSFDKDTIILDGVDNVTIKNNEFSVLSPSTFDVSAILVTGGEGNNILNNNIFINSKARYSYAISITNPSNVFVKKLSKNLTVSDNNILIRASGVAEGIYTDSLFGGKITRNSINIISDGSSYGIAVCNVFSKPQYITIDSNLIMVNSKEMSYLVEIYGSDSIEVLDNHLIGLSNGIYAVGIYNSRNITINRNEIDITGKSLTSGYVDDVLGKGNIAFYIAKTSQINSILRNVIYVENAKLIQKDLGSVIKNFGVNSYVISDNNYDIYFNSDNKLITDVVKDNDIILFRNFTSQRVLDITIPVTIGPYKHLNNFKAMLILSENSNKSTIFGFNFTNAVVKLNKVNNINVFNNTFTSSKLIDVGGFNNKIYSNIFDFKLNRENGVVLEDTLNDIFTDNIGYINSTGSNFILIKKSTNVILTDNVIDGFGSSVVLITSDSSTNNAILNNNLTVNANDDSYIYKSFKTINDNVLNNNINIDGDSHKSAIYYDDSSSNNVVKLNMILSASIEGKDYAVIVNTDSFSSNVIANNYLISANGFRKGNSAVLALYETVCNNTPVILYVSADVNVTGDGSFESPYSTLREAIENSLSGAIIYILPGYYNESDLIIDKNITLTAINNEGSVYIDALNNRLFNITVSGILTVNALKFFNGFSVEGGSIFKNLGTLNINNSMIYNCSSYYNNSNPEFFKIKYDKTHHNSFDCENLGLGGAILNYGQLFIDSSTLFDNFAHKGGAIADFGKTTIKNSLIVNNTAVHGGAIFTDTSLEFNIDNCVFLDNLAIQTLDYCYIQRTTFSNGGYGYQSLCDFNIGHGGAIFSNSTVVISNSLFERNIAKSGGAIAHHSDFANSFRDGIQYFPVNVNPDESKFNFIPNLRIENSVFRYNEAKDTSCGNLTMIADRQYDYYYSINFNGGAIFGSIDQLSILDSLFEFNVAKTDGGALCVQCENSVIEGSKFYNNTAGDTGGAMELFGTYQVFNTEIINNYAVAGGAMKYVSYNYYMHAQKNIDMFNVTVAGNVALDYGGAFAIGIANFAITNSNIYDNKAPRASTFSGGNYAYIDARSNWWGSVNGPDDSVWNIPNTRFRTWLSNAVDWNAVDVNAVTPNENNGNNGNNNNGNSFNYNNNDASTGSGVHTGSTLRYDSNSYGGKSREFTFTGNWPSGNGGNSLYGGNGSGNSLNGGNGNALNSNANSGNSRTTVSGQVSNPNSLSKVNSSSVNDLSSVGMSANAADSSSSSSSLSRGENNGEDGSSSSAYEIIKEVKKEMNEDFSIFNLLLVVAWGFFFIGFYRRYKFGE